MSKDTGVRLQSNGDYWQAAWYDSQGKRKVKSLGSKANLSKRAAERKCRELSVELHIAPAKRDAHRCPTLEGWADQYKQLRRHELGERTMIEHETTIGYLLDRIGGHTTIDQVSRASAADFRAHLAGKGLTEATIRKHIRNCKVIFGKAVEMDLIGTNPFDRQAGSTPAADADWHYVDMDQLDKLLDACPDDRWRTLLALCRLAGLRLGEALRLTWQHVDWQGRTLTVHHEGRQTTKKRKRTVPIQPRLMTVLLQRFEQAQPGETVTSLKAGNLNRDVEVYIKRAELEPWSKPFHTLRKNLESDWLAEYPVMDVCRWLGHDPAVAAKHYHQVKDETLDQVTGIAAEREQTELERLREQVKRERARVRRVIQLAKARQA